MKKTLLFFGFFLILILIEIPCSILARIAKFILNKPPLVVINFSLFNTIIEVIFTSILTGILVGITMKWLNTKYQIDASNNFLSSPALFLFLILMFTKFYYIPKFSDFMLIITFISYIFTINKKVSSK